MKPTFRRRLLLAAALLLPHSLRADDFKPGTPVDASAIVFNRKAWEDKKLPLTLTPWEGKKVTFLTTDQALDPVLIHRFVDRLDAGWLLYTDLTGLEPGLFKQLAGKPTITAVPSAGLTCGAGCGYVGSTGVELAMFYDTNYPALQANPENFPHYAFYELGRNFYTFGDRHSCFITGFAVFMRYVCMDTLKCRDVEPALRTHIDRVEQALADSGAPFLNAFTMQAGAGEKAPRLKGPDGKSLDPCDQPVIYATAMLKLHRECGGNDWLRKFYRHLATCPEVKPVDGPAALQQSLNWLASASLAAGRDLSPLFTDRWRLPLTPPQRAILSSAKYADPATTAPALVKQLTEVK